MSARTLAIALVAAAVALVAIPVAGAAADEKEQLKERFKKRYPTLLKLKNAGKAGETHAAMVDAVKSEYLGEKVDGEKTVKDFLAEENKDRKRLFEILAKEADLSPEVYAERMALRNFKKAKPEHFLKLKDGKWVRRKDWKPPEEE